MGSDDFIDLGAYSDSDHKCEDNGTDNLDSRLSEGDCKAVSSQMIDAIPSGNNTEIKTNDETEEGDRTQKMYLEVGSVQAQPIIQQSLESVESVTMAECTTNTLLIDESPIAGVKRARMSSVDQQPSVHIVYSSLTRESKKKLMELMQQWSEWHAQCQSSSSMSSKESMEYGEETYFPALNIGSEKSSTVTFWLDNQSRKEDIMEYRLDNESIPLYDRGCTLGSTLPDGSANPERIGTLESSRCFNCASYAHSLKECPKPRDNVAISNARKQHSSKRNQGSGSRGAVAARYYQKSSGKFDDLKAGVLGTEARESLGIGEYDPPPWLHRMREMGYPPGYLDVVEDDDQPSGITIIGNEETVEYEDGELPEKGEPEKKMSVEFPGINAPVPETADQRRWASSGFSGSHSFKIRSHPRSEPQQFDHPYHDRRRASDHWDDGPPGAEYGTTSAYSPRYGPTYDSSNSAAARSSPSFTRSLSDRGWRTPLQHESSPGHNPYPYNSGIPRQSPQYQSPTSFDRWNGGGSSPYSASPDAAAAASQQQQQGRDHRRHKRK